MEPVEIKKGIYWVGAVDWDLRNFHGYATHSGTTYNAYLIIDEKIVLVDNVKTGFFDEMLSRIRQVVDPSKIDYIVSNHTEMDHSGSILELIKIAPNAKVVASPQGEKALKRHFKKEMNFQVVKTGDSIPIGKRTLKFLLMPMVHWPDSMATYIPEEKLLLPNDAFGQHIASASRFDDEVGWDVLFREASKYYATIVMPFGEQVKKALSDVSPFEIDMIGPSHGIIWRSYIPKIVESYVKWSANATQKKALIVYYSMWGSTEKIAYALREGLEKKGIPVTIRNLEVADVSDVLTDLLESRMVLIGSPTVNAGIFPPVSNLLSFIKGLKPKNRIGFAFGSYGWSGQAVKEIEGILKSLGWGMPIEGTNLVYVPDDDELRSASGTGEKLGEILKNDGGM